ncbi:hypothetical protein PHYPSEUDO_006088 [Phytophthora pseudosyringae]|uniref:M96 mating-specific protein family n=1 Tax=Phytophthora pseudosyringae TaxID=221518 RepID=A0A8T1VMU6_9STRA|nr:hypothetical protein PHYPSEUDO_006088 [Phytophthora pseudosyringae]
MAFLQDDARVFEAALSFVDEYSLESPDLNASVASSKSDDGPSFALDCREASGMVPLSMAKLLNGAGSSGCLQLRLPPGDEEPPKAAKKAKKAAANPNRVRDEAQYELAFLREQVTQLELQLKSLHLNATSTRQMNAALSSRLEQVPRVWKEVAGRQRRRRDDAQRDNVRLRLIVERKRKMATGLSALLRKRLTQQVRNGLGMPQMGAECLRGKGSNATERRAACVLDFQGDIGDFQELFHHLQTACHEVDAVFAASGLSTMEIPTTDVRVREGVDGRYIEVFANKLLPFSLQDTGEAAWNHFKGVEKHFDNGGLYEKAAKNLDQPYTIIEDFTKEMFSNNSRADIKAKQIVQRIVDPDRDVILFVSSVIPTEIKHKPIDGLVYHAREYALTKRFSASTREHELSLLQLYVRISFDYDPGVVFDSRHVRSVAQFMIGNVAGSLRCYQERIENTLIDQALRRQ